MRKIILVRFLSVLIIVGFYSTVLFGQIPTYTCTLANDSLTGSNIYEFDIYLLNTGTAPLQLGGIQWGFLYNNAVKNGGTLSVSIVPGSVDPVILATGQANKNFNASTNGCIKVAAVLSANGPGTGANISSISPGTRIGRMRLTNSVPFLTQSLSLVWNFSSASGYYPTKLSVYIPASTEGVNTDITDPSMFLNALVNPALPVELTSFVSNATGRVVNLRWETKTEVNTKEFDIEQTKSGSNGLAGTWTTIDVIKAAGTSLSAKQYSYSEKNLQAGKYQYRLKIVDNDGSYKYSKVIETEIFLPREFSINQNYPNPFNPSTKIDYQVPVEANVVLEVYGITGKKVAELVNQDQQAGFYSVNFGTLSGKIASGVYIYRFTATEKATGNNFSRMKKMVLLK